MSISYDLDCGEEVITLELLDDGTLITYGFDLESEIIAREMGFDPHPCLAAIDAALEDAVGNRNIDIVELLLFAGADVHANNNSALRYAAIHNHADVVEILLEHGADVNDAAFLLAIMNNCVDVVKIFLEHGARVHCIDKQWWAKSKSRSEIVRIMKDWIKDHG